MFDAARSTLSSPSSWVAACSVFPTVVRPPEVEAVPQQYWNSGRDDRCRPADLRYARRPLRSKVVARSPETRKQLLRRRRWLSKCEDWISDQRIRVSANDTRSKTDALLP